MYFTNGSYSTPANSSWFSLTTRARVSQIGRKISEIQRWTIHTVLIGDSQSELDTLITDHLNGMKQSNVDLTFYKDDGSETAHKIVNANTKNGVTYMGHSFPGYFQNQWGAHTEYVYLRYVVTQHEAEVFDIENNIMFYTQSFEFSLGGPDYVCVGAFVGLAQTQFTMLSPPFWARQTGTAVGIFSHPSPPGPLVNVPIKPQLSRTRRDNAREFGRVRNIGYPVHWNYLFESPFPMNVAPPDNF